MSDQPTVCCVMLVYGREAMVRRAIASFREQTYGSKRLLIWDSSPGLSHDHEDEQECIFHMPAPIPIAATIGALRNQANRFACMAGDEDDLIAHWDSDDWSHPRRLEEQVALLLSIGKRAVGYRELVFWDTRTSWGMGDRPVRADPYPTAWIYRNHQQNWAAGASLLYRRELWERQPFENVPHEDQRWVTSPAVSGELLGVSSLTQVVDVSNSTSVARRPIYTYLEPRLIAQMHGANTEQISRQVMLDNPDVWRRAPEMDEYCERTMTL